MNSIRYLFESLFYNLLFVLKLDKILRIYRDKVVKSFDLVGHKNSYWIKCNEEYVCPPQAVDEEKEFYGSIKKQSKIIVENWQYFPPSARKELLGLTKYIVWLRKIHLNKNQYGKHNNGLYQDKVSDHIYEM